MFDIAVNLADSKLRDDAEGVLARAQDAGVKHCLLVGTDIEESEWLAGQADRFNQPFTAGIHPHYVGESDDDDINTLRNLAQHPNCVAIGETGLDYFRLLAPADVQRKLCHAQLSLAVELDKPAYLHDRDASDDLIRLLKKFPEVSGVVHCFTGTQEALETYLEMGLSIGITAWCLDERRGRELAALVPLIPDERLLVETDAPYLVPRTIRPRPRKNEPRFLGHIIEGIAALRNQHSMDLAAITHANAKRLFQC